MKLSVKENLSFKFVAFGVALVLWISMLGRKDTAVTRDFELQVMLPPRTVIENQIPLSVRVEISGPRVIVKKVVQSNSVYTVDLTNAKLGVHQVVLNREGLNLPIGARVLTIEPREFSVNLASEKIQ